MKKIITSVALASVLFTSAQAEVFTGTSVVVGFSALGQQVRLDQYVGSTDFDMLYAKVGMAQEISDDEVVSSITSAIAGIGVNVLDMNDFFIDLSAEYYFQVAGGANAGDTYSDSNGVHTVAKDTDYNSAAGAAGVGYSYGDWSYRLDYVYMLNNPEVEIVGGWTTYQASRDMVALSVTYWW